MRQEKSGSRKDNSSMPPSWSRPSRPNTCQRGTARRPPSGPRPPTCPQCRWCMTGSARRQSHSNRQSKCTRRDRERRWRWGCCRPCRSRKCRCPPGSRSRPGTQGRPRLRLRLLMSRTRLGTQCSLLKTGRRRCPRDRGCTHARRLCRLWTARSRRLPRTSPQHRRLRTRTTCSQPRPR